MLHLLGRVDYCWFTNHYHVPDLLSKPNISEYRALSEGAPYTIEIGPHGGGHYVIR